MFLKAMHTKETKVIKCDYLKLNVFLFTLYRVRPLNTGMLKVFKMQIVACKNFSKQKHNK